MVPHYLRPFWDVIPYVEEIAVGWNGASCYTAIRINAPRMSVGSNEGHIMDGKAVD